MIINAFSTKLPSCLTINNSVSTVKKYMQGWPRNISQETWTSSKLWSGWKCNCLGKLIMNAVYSEADQKPKPDTTFVNN